MKRLLLLSVLLIVTGSTASAQAPVPWVAPWATPWGVSIPIAPALPPPVLVVPAPDVIYRDHAAEKHGVWADVARDAAKDPRNCNTYVCDSSRSPDNWLQICTIPGDPKHIAIQWLFKDSGKTYEGTSFVKRVAERGSYLRRNGCTLTA